MSYPCLKINLSKVGNNCRLINDRCAGKGISVVGVLKCVLADPVLADVFKENGIDILGDSRLANIKKLHAQFSPAQKLILLRTPMLSETSEVASLCYASMNTQEETVTALSRASISMGKIHRIIIMVETDDEREGLLPKEVMQFCGHVIKNCPGVRIWGLGTNARCISDKKPTIESIDLLVKISEEIEEKFGINIPVLSGGNSSIWRLIEKGHLPGKINQVRIGEAIFLGHETADYGPIEGAYRDAFILDSEIIEIKKKNDKIYKIITALGKQDADFAHLRCIEENMSFLDQSSDHTVLAVKGNREFEVGDIISFEPDYFGILFCMTSPFVEKVYLKDRQ